MFGRDKKPDPVEDDFKALDQEISQLNQADESDASDASDASNPANNSNVKPNLPVKSPSLLTGGKSFDIINHRPVNQTQQISNPKEAEVAEAEVKEAYAEDEEKHDSLISSIKHHSGQQFISADEDGNEADTAEVSATAVTFEERRDADNNKPVSAESSETQPPSTSESQISFNDEGLSGIGNKEKVEEIDDNLKPESESTPEYNEPNVHSSVGNRLVSGKNNPEISVFDTKEYHAPLHDWSSVEKKTKSKAPVFILAALVLVVGVAIILFFVIGQ